MKHTFTCVSLITGLSAALGASGADCAKVQAGLGKLVLNVVCFASTNLTTANPTVTPPDRYALVIEKLNRIGPLPRISAELS